MFQNRETGRRLGVKEMGAVSRDTTKMRLVTLRINRVHGFDTTVRNDR